MFNSNCCYDEEIVFVDCAMNNLQPQSGVDAHPTSADSTSEQVNVAFDDLEESGTVMDNVANTLYKPTSSMNADIAKYLSRPVLIDTLNLAIGASANDNIYPWHLFFNHTSIKKKIDNYAFIRCDLHIKVVVNASPFYYTAIQYSYNPLYLSFNSAFAYGNNDQVVPHSQRPSFNIYPQTCEGGEMILPFLYYKEWLPLTSATILEEMGRLSARGLTTLKSANGATGTSIDVQVYAWAENVELSGLTVALAVQSGSEYGKGVISKPASAIARSTGLLSNIPVIGPFMTATSIAANAVSNIASLFGYTKVPVLNDTLPYKNLPFHGLAVADVSDATERLCIDSKNELTVNNTCIGDVNADPLLLSDFVQRKSYLTKFSWVASDPTDTLLWNSYVIPAMASVTAGTSQTYINGTPMWVVNNLFRYWRGDIIFDIKIVCSQYHKGRLRVSWDPIGDIAATADSSTEVYTAILDISESTSVSLRVPYCQKTAYLKTPSTPNPTVYDTSALPVDTTESANGILTIRVLNEQTSPIASADINVLVYVRGAENLEFACPKSIDQSINFYEVQSGIEEQKEVNFGGNSSVDSNINLVYMGEQVVNLRSLLMRCNQTLVEPEVIPIGQTEYQYSIMSRRPLYRGFDPKGIHTATEVVGVSTAPFNFVNTTPYHMLSQCFLGERGSFTWKVDYDATEHISFMISRPKWTLSKSLYPFTALGMGALSDSAISHLFATEDDTASGMLLLNQRTNTGVSFNAPQYSIYSFYPTAPVHRTEGYTGIDSDDAIRYTHIIHESDRTEIDYSYHRYMFQVGHDYSPVFFLNVPTMYLYDTPSPP
jgi:hypothetical protein